MSPVTFDFAMKIVVEGKNQPSGVGTSMLKPNANPEVKLDSFFRDLTDDVRNEFYALMALGQEACEQLPDKETLPDDATAFGSWKPKSFDEYRQRSQGFTFEYFWSKPLLRYLPLGRRVVEIFGLRTYRTHDFAGTPW